MSEPSAAPEPVIKPPRQPRPRLPKPSSRRWGMNPEDRMRVMEASLVLPGAGWLMHFSLMMSMSVIVAIMGLSANSPALVIGAMLIAPLMTPVLGIAASIAMALGDAVTRSVMTVTFATVGAIFVSWLVAGVLPGDLNDLLTGEVLARTAPDVRDLVVALAAGVAGSYATARPDVSSSLPGVAIAVALVPPLAVVGITLRADAPDLAAGAMLLYVTNLAAIVTVSTVVFIAAGFVPSRRLASMAPRVLAGGILGVAVVAVLGVLLTSRTIASGERAREVADITTATDQWLKAEAPFNDFELDVDDTRVRVRVTGPQVPPPSGALDVEIENLLGEPRELEVTWFQGQTNDSLRAAEAAGAAVTRWQSQESAVRESVQDWLEVGGDETAVVSELQIDGQGVSVSVSSGTQPPPKEVLEELIAGNLGEPIPVEIGWRDLSAEAAEAAKRERENVVATAQALAAEWALDRAVSVNSVTYVGDLVEVELFGEPAPDGASLSRELQEVLPSGASLAIYFVERTTVFPVPTPTPTPEPTPTPPPTPTPVPTPTPEPTPTPDP